MRRTWALIAYDAATGAATLPVAVLGVDGADSAVSWVPLEHAAGADWRTRLGAADPAAAVDGWLETANGVVWGLVELDPPGTPDLRGDVEVLLDDFLTAGA